LTTREADNLFLWTTLWTWVSIMSGGLTQSTIKNLIRVGDRRRTCDGDGLYLDVRAKGRGQWVFRYTLAGRAREIGLGRASGPEIEDVRGEVAALRQLIRRGVHPRDAEAEQRRRVAEAEAEAARTEQAAQRTFKVVAEAMLAQHEPAWRNPKHRQQWRNTLATHVYGALGELPVAGINTENVLSALTPIWTKTPETASRVRGRIERVLAYAKAQGWRTGDNPAAWRGHLDTLLASPHKLKLARSRHQPALPWRLMPEFMPALRAAEGTSARALEFLILTAARSGEVRLMTWGEVDIGNRQVWIVPPERMKAGREHRVPLSPQAVKALAAAKEWREHDGPNALVFPGARAGRPLSDMSLSAALRRMVDDEGLPRWVDDRGAAIVPHGFRSTFRDWAAECHGELREVAEAALAHSVGSATERAYLRSDVFERRRALMEAWANYCVNK
jgi:integrase